VHLGGETSPALLCSARECANHDVGAAAAGVDDLAADGPKAAANAIPIDGTADGTRHDEAEAGWAVVVAVESVIHGAGR
jgi:hypothetical protein